MKQLDLFTPISKDERQEQGRKTWIKNKCKGTFVWPTGTGKTYGAIKCIKSIVNKYPNFKVLVVVPTDPLKNQWQTYFDENDLAFNCEVQIINTVVKNYYKCNILVLDEIHRYASDLFAKVFEVVDYKYILGLTATFERLDGKEALISKYCPVIDTILVEEALFNGWISQYKEYAVLLDVDDIDVYNEYNKEFYEHFEFFNWDFGLAKSMIGPTGYKARLAYRNALCPNGSEAERSMVLKSILKHITGFTKALQNRKRFINNHPKKLEVARKIIEKRNDKKIITFSNNVKMAESIGIGEVYTGKISKKKGRTTIKEFNNKSAPAVINSVAKLNEGADLKGLSVAIHLGIDSSKTKAVQKRGRVIRFEPGKMAENFILIIKGTVEEKWLSNAYGSSITKINEDELDQILNGVDIDISNKPLTDLIFRW